MSRPFPLRNFETGARPRSAGVIAVELRVPAGPIGIDRRRRIIRRRIIPVRRIAVGPGEGTGPDRGPEGERAEPEADCSPGTNSAAAMPTSAAPILCIGGAGQTQRRRDGEPEPGSLEQLD